MLLLLFFRCKDNKNRRIKVLFLHKSNKKDISLIEWVATVLGNRRSFAAENQSNDYEKNHFIIYDDADYGTGTNAGTVSAGSRKELSADTTVWADSVNDNAKVYQIII